jgi:hypothetical protein
MRACGCATNARVSFSWSFFILLRFGREDVFRPTNAWVPRSLLPSIGDHMIFDKWLRDDWREKHEEQVPRLAARFANLTAHGRQVRRLSPVGYGVYLFLVKPSCGPH